MKLTIFLLLSFFIAAGCASSRMLDKQMEVVNATYKPWSEPPPSASDVPEKGTDLTVSVQHWPDDYTPQYIIYEHRRTHSARIANKAGVTVFIKGRIIRSSSVMRQTSEKVELSDRLVYTDAEGDTSFVEIEDWAREE